MVGSLVGNCRCSASWCDFDLSFDLDIVTFSLKIISGVYQKP